jgi:esterase/lipase superfamily enzyme
VDPLETDHDRAFARVVFRWKSEADHTSNREQRKFATEPELVPKIIGYRQVSDATLLHLARVSGLKLVTFDRPVAAVCPCPDHLELLTP